jgi:gliding motility-associated protein GldE
MILSSFLFAFMPAGTIIVYVILILVLLIFSALISGSEVAFFSLGPTEKDLLKSEDSRNGNLALKLLEKPQELLATILIVNNFLNVGIVIFSSSLLNKLFHDTGSSTFHFILEVLSITFMILMIGEVIPKVYATKNGLLFAKLMAFPLRSLSSIPPFSWLKSFLVNGTKIIHKYAKYRGVSITTDELEQAILLTKEESTSEEEQKILEGIIKFGNTDVKQIMRSRMEVVYLEEDFDFQIVLNKILEAGYSRIPVIRDSFDQVEGILYVKDLLSHINEKPDFAWKSLMRKPFFVPENKKIDDLLKDFQEKKMHMAIVVDEYGGGSGLVTLEDVLEEIVGDITEEFDEDVVGFKQISPNTYIFEGRTALVDLYKVLEIDGKEFESEKGESDSIGGFIIEQSGRILKNNEFIKFKNYKLIVVSSDKRRIKSVKIVIGQN